MSEEITVNIVDEPLVIQADITQVVEHITVNLGDANDILEEQQRAMAAEAALSAAIIAGDAAINHNLSSNYVPYQNAHQDVDLGSHSLDAAIINAFTVNAGNIVAGDVDAAGHVNADSLLAFNTITSLGSITGNSIAANSITISGNPVAIAVDPVRTTLIGNGITTSFAISGAQGLVNPSALIVAIDGALQEPGVDYSIANNIITFTSAVPLSSKAVVVTPTNSVQVAQLVPSDGSVSSSKLATGAALDSINQSPITFTQPVSATGQPHAQSLNSSSVVTRSTLNSISRPIFNTINYALDLTNWSAFATAGFNTEGHPNCRKLQGTGALSGGSITILPNNAQQSRMKVGNNKSSIAFASCDFGSKIILSVNFLVASTRFSHTTDSIAFCFGNHLGVNSIGSTLADLFPTTNSVYVGFRTLSGALQLVGKNNANAQVVSPTLATLSDISHIGDFTIEVQGGTASLYRNGIFQGSIGGMSTVLESSGFSTGLHLTTSATTIREIYTQALAITWE